MDKNITFSCILIAILIFASADCAKTSLQEKTGIASFLPDPQELKDWKKERPSELYMGEDLFQYINGGAEIYHEYGFVQVLVQDFSSRNGRSVSIEIYEMEAQEAAYGIYTFKSSSSGQAVDFGNEGRLEGYYLNFWRSNFLVTLTGFDEVEETVQGLLLIAESIDKKMSSIQKKEKSQLVHLLPEEGHILSSTKYFKGHLGFFNIYPFSTLDIFKIEEGVRGRYISGHEIFILSYSDAKSSSKQYREAGSHFRNSPRYKKFQETEKAVLFEDKKDKLIMIQPHQNCIIIVSGASSQKDAEKIIKRAAAQIESLL
jgi:hypothetical protein